MWPAYQRFARADRDNIMAQGLPAPVRSLAVSAATAACIAAGRRTVSTLAQAEHGRHLGRAYLEPYAVGCALFAAYPGPGLAAQRLSPAADGEERSAGRRGKSSASCNCHRSIRPLLAALAVGFSVSIAQYLPTLYAGAGRFATVTTEAVALSSAAIHSSLQYRPCCKCCCRMAIFIATISVSRPGRHPQKRIALMLSVRKLLPLPQRRTAADGYQF
ncbi:Inner membrane ABC transporter permease protein ynjC [Cedecea neteri]|uniref:Inner membrane ABC transporter permease protein ynjC n=1 Tax=Cedecea neteri TaxID=158822 RepID=A0A2X3J5Q4_9ENTR|nr:Inner membrane ABC transporter permease protein ynjC [Cedecea neteri]